MATTGPTAVEAQEHPATHRDHGFHPVAIARVVAETSEASSFALAVPPELTEAFAYRAGQFCTFRLRIDGQAQLRSYSMSSSPDVDDELVVTVKRVPGGTVSNWMLDTLAAGDTVETTCPAGVFCLGEGDGDVVAYAAGSGITPVHSIVKTALATTARRVRLLYANRDRPSVIFGDQLAELEARYPGRLEVVHRFDAEQGYLDDEAVRAFTGPGGGGEHFICGPEPFMDIVEGALVGAGVDRDQIRIERFTPAEAEPEPAPAGAGAAPTDGSVVTIELEGRTDSVEHRPGTTILQTARQMGMAPPYSCESGTCATCMAKVVEGAVTMRCNNALTDDEVAEGWVLTCQSVPTTPTVHVVYEEV